MKEYQEMKEHQEMKEYQEDPVNQDIEICDSNNETQKKECNLLGHKSRKSFLFLLFGLICLVGLISAFIVGEYFKPNTTGITPEQNVPTKEVDPEIRNSGSSEAIKEGALMTDNNKEQERLNALAEESRVYCIISSAPYFQDIESKGSLSISKEDIILKYVGNMYKMEWFTEEAIDMVYSIDDSTTSGDFDDLRYKSKSIYTHISCFGNIMTVSYDFEYNESKTETEQVDQKISKLFQKWEMDKLSDYKKIKKIHDYIIKNASYDTSLEHYSAYDNLIN